MRKMKILASFFLLSLNPLFGFSQNSIAASAVSSDIGKVVNDYPNQFRNLVGELLTENVQTTDYGSKVCVTGASQCIITKYSAEGKDIYSWQAVMPATENFEEVKKQYRNLYNQMQNIVLMMGEKKYTLSASYKEPTETVRFSSIIFSADSKDEGVKKLKVELLLEADVLEWHIRILVYDREREDDEKGDVFEQK